MNDDGVIQFRTANQRAAEADRAYVDGAREEAIRMLEEALELAKSQQGRSCTGVAIAMTFSDRYYASHVPLKADNCGSLIAALVDCQWRLMKLINGD